MGTPSIIEIDARNSARETVAGHMARGDVVILRGIAALETFRNGFVEHVQCLAPGGGPEMTAFLANGETPSLPTLSAVAATIRKVRAERYLSQCLAPFVAQLGFGTPVRLDGGIPRLVLPPAVLEEARNSGLFATRDFQRLRSDGETEVFMPRPANVHRDYNRQHYLLQCNLWFPLHDADEESVLRLYPHLYRENVFDMDATPENFGRLGAPLRFRLNFGDAVIFHGEHLHTSPPTGAEFRRRLSFDFRIASLCGDDTKHYREFFLDLRDFDLTERPARRLGGSPAGEETSPLPVLLAVEQGVVSTAEGFAAALASFDRFAFAEDRYLILAEKAQAVAPRIATEACLRIIERSDLWFWMLMAAGMLLQKGMTEPARRGLEKARALAAAVREMPNFMPVAYMQGPMQPMPQTVIATCEALLQRLGAPVAAAR